MAEYLPPATVLRQVKYQNCLINQGMDWCVSVYMYLTIYMYLTTALILV